MKEYTEPQIVIIEYSLSDIISASQYHNHTHGSESGNEFSYNDNSATEETTLPDWIVPTDDNWW